MKITLYGGRFKPLAFHLWNCAAYLQNYSSQWSLGGGGGCSTSLSPSVDTSKVNWRRLTTNYTVARKWPASCEIFCNRSYMKYWHWINNLFLWNIRPCFGSMKMFSDMTKLANSTARRCWTLRSGWKHYVTCQSYSSVHISPQSCSWNSTAQEVPLSKP